MKTEINFLELLMEGVLAVFLPGSFRGCQSRMRLYMTNYTIFDILCNACGNKLRRY
jgi:hypothetical protein